MSPCIIFPIPLLIRSQPVYLFVNIHSKDHMDSYLVAALKHHLIWGLHYSVPGVEDQSQGLTPSHIPSPQPYILSPLHCIRLLVRWQVS